MSASANTGRCLICGLLVTDEQHGQFCAICATSMQQLGVLRCDTGDASIATSESSRSMTLINMSDHQHAPSAVLELDYIPSQPQDTRMRTSQSRTFRIDSDDGAILGSNFREIGHELTLAHDVPSEEELVEMIIELFLSYLSRPRLVCSATLDSIPRTNLNLDHSKLYRAALQVDGCETLNAIVIDPGLQPQPFHIDKPLVGLESSISTSVEGSRIRACIKEEGSIVVLERWKDIPNRTIEILNSMSFGGIVLIDEGDAASCIMQYTKAGLPRSVPVIVVKECIGKGLLHLYSAGLSRLDCKLTIETAVERCCSICFEMMDVVMTLPQCGHIIHETCGVEWLSSQKSCPFCRQEVQDIHQRNSGKVRSP